MNLTDLISIRKELHAHPELSGLEVQTSKKIISQLKQFKHFTVKRLGKTGVLATIKGKKKGQTLMFRAELDALPIKEINDFPHKSTQKGVGHKCGHDGHMTILLGLAAWLNDNPPPKGTVGLLFQPAEEIGEGAQEMLNAWPKNFKPDLAVALHNLPGLNQGEVYCRPGLFALASEGLVIHMKGKESHASQPENGINPAYAIQEIIQAVKRYRYFPQGSKKLGLVTPIHFKLGKEAFGTSAGKANMMFTLRSSTNDKLKKLENYVKSRVGDICKQHKIEVEFESREHFHDTQNYPRAVNLVKNICKESNIPYHRLGKPFRWSEDFGLFSKKFNGVLFGLGAGKDTPALHNPDYDFNDKIIPPAIEVFSGVVKKILF